jgi:hypothetical protein
MRHQIFLVSIVGLIFSGNLLSQSNAPTPASSSDSTASADKSTPVTFRSDFLDLSFTYPGSLTAQSLPTLDEQHAQIAKNQPENEPAEYKRVDSCTDKALIAQRKDDPQKAGASIAIFGDQRGTVVQFSHPVDAAILIARVGIDCMPATYREHIDDIAQQMAEGGAQGDGLKTIDQPVWYNIGQTKIHFAAAQDTDTATTSTNNANAKMDHKWVVSVAFVLKSNLVTIYLESNDLPFLNEMLHSKIALGQQDPAPLFSSELGNGTPLQPKP